MKCEHPYWGARKIKAHLEAQYNQSYPAESTIGDLLHRHGLTVAGPRRAHRDPQTEPLAHADGPNRVWSVDFKGWFKTGDGRVCYPLTLTDNYSRYLLRCQGLPVESTLYAKPVLEAAFREYGLPERIRSDNGAPFGSNGGSGLTALAVWWIRLGIVPERIWPGCPQQNGRHERMHRTLKQETAAPPRPEVVADAKRRTFTAEYKLRILAEADAAVPATYAGNPSGSPAPGRSASGSGAAVLPTDGGPARWKNGARSTN